MRKITKTINLILQDSSILLGTIHNSWVLFSNRENKNTIFYKLFNRGMLTKKENDRG